MNRKILLSFAAGLLTLGHSKAQTAFPVGVNVALAKPGMNSAAKIYTLYTNTNAASGNFTSGATFTPAYDINGIGLNPMDNLLYGASFVGDDNTVNNNVGVSLRRVGADGTVIDLGLLPTSGQTSLEFPNFSAGAVASNGAYYYMTFGLKPSGVTKVFLNSISPATYPLNLNANDLRMFLCWKNDVSSLPANPGGNISGGLSGYYELDFSHPDMTAALNAFLADVNANYPDVYNADGGLQDFSINPVNTRIYGYISYPSGGTTVGRPVVVNPPNASGMASIVPVGTTVNNVPGQEVAGVQFDAAGNFYGLFTTGHFAQIDLSTGALSGLAMSNVTTLGGNLRGDLASAITNVPFPVQLVSFEGKNTGTANELTWVTASEQGNKEFVIERSADSRTWSGIGMVASKGHNGSSNSRLSYTFTDLQPAAGDNFYRLKQRDLDGKTTFSGTVQLQYGAGQGQPFIFPNPTSGSLYLSGATAGSQVLLTDLTGRRLLTMTAVQGNTRVDMGNVAPGIYQLLVLEQGIIRQSFKVARK